MLFSIGQKYDKRVIQELLTNIYLDFASEFLYMFRYEVLPHRFK